MLVTLALAIQEIEQLREKHATNNTSAVQY